MFLSLILSSAVNFNPRSRKESDPGRHDSAFSQNRISIHALARRATPMPICDFAARIISIHALARRATSAPQLFASSHTDFNPRSRKESDGGRADSLGSPNHFNPRSRKESDARQTMNRLIQRSFQSTLSQGERQAVLQKRGFNVKFQSTLSQGERRVGRGKDQNGESISIHALARRATR